MSEKKMPFSETIYHLRTIEQIVLYNKLTTITKEEESETTLFLETEYEREALNHPFTVPEFNPVASLWAAKTVYLAAQLLLYRDHKVSELITLLPKYDGKTDAGTFLSADLCLRFLPQIIMEMKQIDADDAAISILESHLLQFHYSGIGFDVEVQKCDLDVVFSDACFEQLYLNRIVERKAIKFAEMHEINLRLAAGFGDYKQVYGREL